MNGMEASLKWLALLSGKLERGRYIAISLGTCFLNGWRNIIEKGDGVMLRECFCSDSLSLGEANVCACV